LLQINSLKAVDLEKKFRKLSYPMVTEMLFQNLFNLVDTFFVSKVGYAAIAAVTSSAILLMLFMAIGFGISASSGSLIAIEKGKGGNSKISYILYDALLLALTISLITVAFSNQLAQFLPYMLGLKEKSYSMAHIYLKINFYGMPLFFVLPIINSALRSIGEPSKALKIIILSNIVNLILDPVLILGLGIITPMGVKGAAISTVIARMFGVSLQVYFIRKRFIKLSILQYKKSVGQFTTKIIKGAIPAAMHLIWRILSMLAAVKIVSIFGSKPLAAFGIVIRSFQVILFPTFGLGNAAFVLTGQSFGAKRFDLLKKSVVVALKYETAFVATASFIYLIFAPYIIGIFSNDAEIITSGSFFMRLQAISYPAAGATVIFSRIFMGTGDTLTPSIVNLVNLFFFMIPLAYILSVTMSYGANGVWMAIPISNLTGCITFFLLYKARINRWINQ